MNVSAMWQSWLKATTSPNEATYAAEREKPEATLTTAVIYVLIYGVIAAVISMVSAIVFAGTMRGLLPDLLAQANLAPEVRSQLQGILSTSLFAGVGIASSLSNIITIPVFFLIGVGILHLIARLLGGTGQFGRFAFLNAIFVAPLGILTSLVGLVPLVSCLTIFIGIYQLVLTYFAVKVEHQMTSGRAILVVLIPLIVVALLVGCGVAGLVGLIVSSSQS